MEKISIGLGSSEGKCWIHSGGIDGHNALAVIVKAMQSAREGRWLDIEY